MLSIKQKLGSQLPRASTYLLIQSFFNLVLILKKFWVQNAGTETIYEHLNDKKVIISNTTFITCEKSKKKLEMF